MSAVMSTYGRYELEFEKGEGPFLYSTDGRRYLDFAAGIAKLGEAYVNDAFGTCHRDNASMLTVPQMMEGRPRVVGCLMQKELRFLGEALGTPSRPFVCILGGAKVSDPTAELVDELSFKVLVAKDLASNCLFAHAVTSKGASADMCAVQVLVEDLQWLGCSHAVLKGDNEPAMAKLPTEAAKECRIQASDEGGDPIIQEDRPTACDKTASGEAEDAVRNFA